MKRTVLAPMIVLLGLAGSVVLMARSNFFTPVVQFIHSGTITPVQAAVCLLGTVAGFASCFFLLNILCSYFVPRMSATSGNSRVTLQTKTHGGGLKN